MPQIDTLPETVNFAIYCFGAGLVLLLATAGFALMMGFVYDFFIGRVREKHREYVHLKGQYMDFMSWQMYGKPVEVTEPRTGKRWWAMTEKPKEYAEEWALKTLLQSNGFMADMFTELDRKYAAIREAEQDKQR